MPTGRYPRRPKDLTVEFARRVIKREEGGCWVWIGSLQTQGYGQFQVNNRLVLAHRLSWELHRGPIPPGVKVLHGCDNPPCVNPDHLFLGSQKDNMADAAKKGRTRGCPWTVEQRARRGEAARHWWREATREQKDKILRATRRGAGGRFERNG